MNTTNNDAAARGAAAKRAQANEPVSAKKAAAETLREYKAALLANSIQWDGDRGDSWLQAYAMMKAYENGREAAYEKAKRNIALARCRETLLGEQAVSIEGKNSNADMGREGRDWLLEKIEQYFESGEWVIYEFYLHGEAGYEDEIRSEDAVDPWIFKQQEAFIKRFEKQRGKVGKGKNAQRLGAYVNAFLDCEAPAWAAALNQSVRYRVIGELLERAGVLERCRGAAWVKNNWGSMDKGDKANQVAKWGEQAAKEE